MPPKQRPPKPQRYWAGRGEEIAEANSDSGESGDETAPSMAKAEPVLVVTKGQVANGTIYDYNATAPAAASDRRLRRLQTTQNDNDSDESDDAATSRRRRAAPTASDTAPVAAQHALDATANDDDDVEDERRRERLRMIARRRAAEEDAAELLPADDNNPSEQSSEYESESESESEDDFASRKMLKPVFIPKSHRETIHERERLEKEAEAAELKRLADLEARKVESHNLVEEELRKEIAAATVNDTIPDVDDTDGLNEEEEYELWRLRELNRIKRDRLERDKEEKELADIERRRNMTDAEIQAENEKLNPKKEEKKQLKFMQKYYHKGAFFTDEEIVATRDFNEPTLEDKFDKTILPAVMQVKNFGKSGQTKWTHLSKEDTSNRDSAWFQDSDVNKRTLAKMAGMKQSYEKPTARKKSKIE
ncbi:hypothetical protein HDU79_001538 [Rhizoclosmatium sp. JEL0117]|nr:hypothetical protein HDU79_001534 [Rhizoclosmatium sp. JEL0117]KAJ3292328.1 hypothetical protein HDU79_001538 [Rhizoclosmatium sp. JEL0117]